MATCISFGCNDDGQLGRGEDNMKNPFSNEEEITLENLPKTINSTNFTIKAVSCGSRHTIALTKDGKLYSWGWGKLGQLGHGDDASIGSPKCIQYFVDQQLRVEYVSAGGCHSGAVVEKGLVYMWGESHWGQLALSEENNDLHQKIPALCQVLEDESTDKVITISCGGTHTGALTEQGDVYMWGRADSGQLGVGKDNFQSLPAGVVGFDTPQLIKAFHGERILKVACGAFHSACVSENGNVYTWGKEDYGMLGIGFTGDAHQPQLVHFFKDFPARYVSCGGWHTLVVTRDGACYAFGRGEYGRLGFGDSRNRVRPVKIEALKNEIIVQTACGGTHSMFLTKDGKAYSVGRSGHGRLGYMDKAVEGLPVEIQAISDNHGKVQQVSAGGAHSIALCVQN